MLNRPHATTLYKSQSYDHNKFKKIFHTNNVLPLNSKQPRQNGNKKIKNDDASSLNENEDSGGESDWISAAEDNNDENNEL